VARSSEDEFPARAETVPAVVPETRYAVRGDAHIAFQVVGDGPTDVVLVSTWFSHVEARWDIPGFAHFLDRLTAFARVVSFDKLGVGLSDPLPLGVVRPLEEWADEIAVVLDAAGLERAAVVGANEGSMLAILFAATYPERTEALVLADGSARLRLAPDYPDGLPAEVVDGLVALVEGTWGRPDAVAAVNPSIADDPATLDLWARFIRLSASPATATAVTRAMFEFDVRRVLPAVRAPTLVVHRSDTPLPPVAQGRYLAAHIPAATFVEVPGVDYGLGIGEVDAILDPARSSSPVHAPVPCRTGRSRRSSSPTWWHRRSACRRSATGAGASCSSCRTGSCVGSSHGTAARS
jgi:pimeloyl-ACP methyl ester carboxylesterase